MRVIIGDHARQRFRMRGGKGKLSTARIERSLRHKSRGRNARIWRDLVHCVRRAGCPGKSEGKNIQSQCRGWKTTTG